MQIKRWLGSRKSLLKPGTQTQFQFFTTFSYPVSPASLLSSHPTTFPLSGLDDPAVSHLSESYSFFTVQFKLCSMWVVFLVGHGLFLVWRPIAFFRKPNHHFTKFAFVLYSELSFVNWLIIIIFLMFLCFLSDSTFPEVKESYSVLDGVQ